MNILPPAPRPCVSCPYREDVPSGVWAEEEYAKLPDYDREMAFQPLAVFMCHQADGRLCAGWLACHGGENLLSIRMTVGLGRITPDVEDYTTDVPLFHSGQEACEHGLARIDNPPQAARKMVEKLDRKQGRK